MIESMHPMKTQFHLKVLGLLIYVAIALPAFAVDKVREAAIEFSRGWDNCVVVLGFSGLSDPSAFLDYKEKLESHRKVLQANGTNALREAGGELDRLITYVALAHYEAAEARMDAYRWRDPKGEPAKPAPLSFRNAKYNEQLGIVEGEEDPQKIFDALRRVILSFAKTAGVEKELLEKREAISVKPAK